MSDVVIAGVGMMTSVGLSAAETAASVRAGTMRFSEIDYRDRQFEPFVVAEVPNDGIPELEDGLAKIPGLSAREGRLLRLATRPLLECLRTVKMAAPPPLLLALPDLETRRPLNRLGILPLLARQTKNAFNPALSSAEFRGRAGGLLAIAHAVQLIRAGQAEFVLAGGVDTYLDLHILGTLDLQKRVKSAANADGFIPGEGAGFVLLGRREAVRPLVSIAGSTESFEPGNIYSDQPYRGDGLASGLRQLLESCPLSGPIQEVYSSMNGESHWAKEWGVAYLRNSAAFRDDMAIHHPADCFGDTAAACGPLLTGLAAMGMHSGYRRAPALVYCSSDSGQIGLAALAAA
jgi:3-oxoacyl-[acyl-carrier-protein] synthase-1